LLPARAHLSPQMHWRNRRRARRRTSGRPFVYNLRFPGQYFDAETALSYNSFRDYDPPTGRYVESDPIGFGGGVNTYAYTNGNPASRSDPTGLLFGGRINAGECYGVSAAQFWVDKQVSTGNPLYAIPSLLASLWTPSTSDSTLGTLLAGYGAAGLASSAGNISEWLSNPILYEFGQKTLTDAGFDALSGLSAAERGAAVLNRGLGNAIFNLWGNWAKTWGTGPTPAASLCLIGAGTAEALLSARQMLDTFHLLRHFRGRPTFFWRPAA
jgi:RHS repeat-associated protein